MAYQENWVGGTVAVLPVLWLVYPLIMLCYIIHLHNVTGRVRFCLKYLYSNFCYFIKSQRFLYDITLQKMLNKLKFVQQLSPNVKHFTRRYRRIRTLCTGHESLTNLIMIESPTFVIPLLCGNPLITGQLNTRVSFSQKTPQVPNMCQFVWSSQNRYVYM